MCRIAKNIYRSEHTFLTPLMALSPVENKNRQRWIHKEKFVWTWTKSCSKHSVFWKFHRFLFVIAKKIHTILFEIVNRNTESEEWTTSINKLTFDSCCRKKFLSTSSPSIFFTLKTNNFQLICPLSSQTARQWVFIHIITFSWDVSLKNIVLRHKYFSFRCLLSLNGPDCCCWDFVRQHEQSQSHK